MTRRDGNVSVRKEISESLHDHSLVRPEQRATHREIVRQSLTDTPRVDAQPLAGATASVGQDLMIEGTFVPLNDPELCARWCDPAYRGRQFQFMRDIGFHTLILLTGNRGGVCYDSKEFDRFLEIDLLEQVLHDAANERMTVWIGLPHVEIAWMIQAPDELHRLLQVSHGVIDEVYKRYGGIDSFYGWYVPYELCNVFVTSNHDESRLPNWINDIASHCKDVSESLPVAVAPYFTTVDGYHEFDRLWREILITLDAVDVVMMQDSVGIFKDERLRELPTYFSRLQGLARAAKKQLWCDVEVFDQRSGIPLDDDAWSAEPPSCTRVLRQIRSVSAYVDRIVAFSYCDYMNPDAGPEARKLYEDYRSYLRQTRPGQLTR